MSKVEGGGARLIPPSRLRVTIFSRMLLGLIEPRGRCFFGFFKFCWGFFVCFFEKPRN